MSNQLVVLLNGVSQLQYDRNKPLLPQQREFLDKMDNQLREGVIINDQQFDKPDLQQRAQFVAINLLQAIQDSEEQKAAAMCSYLAIFLPDLKQIKAQQHQDGTTIDFIFDSEYVNEIKVQLTPRKI